MSRNVENYRFSNTMNSVLGQVFASILEERVGKVAASQRRGSADDAASLLQALMLGASIKEDVDMLPDTPGYKEFLAASDAEYEQHNLSKARTLYEKACQLGHPLAQVNYALWFLEGRPGAQQKNYRKAFDLFSESAEKKIGMAQYNLANYYYKGTGGIVPIDKEKAYRLVKEAIKDPRVDAMRQGDPYFMLAAMHVQGDGCQKSPKRALEYAEKAHRFGHCGATPEFLKMINLLSQVSADDTQEETDRRWDRMCAWQDANPDKEPSTMAEHILVLNKFGFEVTTKLTKKQLSMKGGFDKFMQLTGGQMSLMQDYETMNDPLPPKKCDHCKASGATKRCAKCGEYYCNRACQVAAWKDHKPVCLAVQATKHY